MSDSPILINTGVHEQVVDIQPFLKSILANYDFFDLYVALDNTIKTVITMQEMIESDNALNTNIELEPLRFLCDSFLRLHLGVWNKMYQKHKSVKQ